MVSRETPYGVKRDSLAPRGERLYQGVRGSCRLFEDFFGSLLVWNVEEITGSGVAG
jgi:hypothetical protein